MTRRFVLVLCAAVAIAFTAAGDDLRDYLRRDGKPPHDYVLEKTARYKVVIVGEGHWIRHDVELVRDLVPDLARSGITLAMETLPASEQATIDRLITGETWDVVAAMAIMRKAAWPYREYLEILRAAWFANQRTDRKMRIVAAGPPADWRDSLMKARGITYDEFMADRVAEVVKGGGSVLLFAGDHHAFTRYHQPELDLEGRAYAFMDRCGNILRRRFGERVFQLALHRPLWCGKSEPWGYCLPLDGRIDCAASVLERPVGFDVARSPVADESLGTDLYYAHGYPSLRFVDFADGWIWTKPIESYRLVTLIPLEEFAPDETSIAAVIANNPFSNQAVSTDQLRSLWKEQEASLANPLVRRKWQGLAGWKQVCH